MREPAWAGRWRRAYGERRFAILLVILLALLAGPPVIFGFGLRGERFDALMTALMVAAVLSLCFEPRQRAFALALGIATVVFSASGHALSGQSSVWVLLVGQGCEATFFFGAAWLIVKSLFGEREVTFDGVFGALCGYLLLGLGWAVVYNMIEVVRPGSFAISQSLAAASEQTGSLPHLLTYYVDDGGLRRRHAADTGHANVFMAGSDHRAVLPGDHRGGTRQHAACEFAENVRFALTAAGDGE